MLTDEYFERQLQYIREIRLSERKFYQKITDIYSTAFDYDKNSNTTKKFFKIVQNKMHWAAHGHTAPELINLRANAQLPLMGMTSFKGKKISLSDVKVAKNYLNEEKIDTLNRIVSMYLEFAELKARFQNSLQMKKLKQNIKNIMIYIKMTFHRLNVIS